MKPAARQEDTRWSSVLSAGIRRMEIKGKAEFWGQDLPSREKLNILPEYLDQ